MWSCDRDIGDEGGAVIVLILSLIFLCVALFGIVWESLLAAYDVRGPIRQLFFLAIFILL